LYRGIPASEINLGETTFIALTMIKSRHAEPLGFVSDRWSSDSTLEPSLEDSRSKPLQPALARGTSIGRYLLLDRVGQGGMGVVYKALDPELGRAVALKLLKTESTAKVQQERLLREAHALARLSHPNVVAVHDVGTFGDDVFVAMEFVEGRTLRDWLTEPRDWRTVLDAFLAAGEGLAAAHRAGLVHRDFKPDNVIVGADGRVRVVDFGLARATGAADPEDGGPAASPGSWQSGRLSSPLTRHDAIIGTPRYMAPEQHRGEAVDEAADQFSFCLSLYWALYDLYPFVGDADEARRNVLAGRVSEPPTEAKVPRWLYPVIVRGLAPHKSDRHPGMAELLATLRADPLAARRQRWQVALLGVAAIALVAAAFAGALAYGTRRAATEQARLAQQFGQEVEKVESMARIAVSLPLHDPERERLRIREHLERLQKDSAALGPAAAGLGHEALGRADLACGRIDAALVELEAARAAGVRTPELAYALAVVHGKAYQRALLADELDAGPASATAAHHREEAVRQLEAVRAGDAPASIDTPELVDAWLALCQQRFADATSAAQHAAERALAPYAARVLEGDALLLSGVERRRHGDPEGALAELTRAGQAYAAALDLAPSGAEAYRGDCQRLLATLEIDAERGRTTTEIEGQAVEACRRAASTQLEGTAPIENVHDRVATWLRRHAGGR
jgi:predicted Ser/Thr protein kinase